MKILFIIGLPGSGKSYLCNNLDNYEIFDDNINLNKVKEALDDNLDICISDCNLCLESMRNRAIEFCKEYTNNIEFIYFENNVEKCLENVKLRNDERKVTNYIHFLSKKYNPPKESKKIWTREKKDNFTPANIVDKVENKILSTIGKKQMQVSNKYVHLRSGLALYDEEDKLGGWFILEEQKVNSHCSTFQMRFISNWIIDGKSSSLEECKSFEKISKIENKEDLVEYLLDENKAIRVFAENKLKELEKFDVEY